MQVGDPIEVRLQQLVSSNRDFGAGKALSLFLSFFSFFIISQARIGFCLGAGDRLIKAHQFEEDE